MSNFHNNLIVFLGIFLLGIILGNLTHPAIAMMWLLGCLMIWIFKDDNG